MKLDLDEVTEIMLTVDEARALIDLEIPDVLASTLDEVQAPVFSGDAEGLLLIRIKATA